MGQDFAEKRLAPRTLGGGKKTWERCDFDDPALIHKDPLLGHLTSKFHLCVTTTMVTPSLAKSRMTSRTALIILWQ